MNNPCPKNPDLDSPAVGAFDISPDDSALLSILPRAIYCSVSGDMTCETENGDAITFVGMIAGMIYPIRVRKVTTATTGTFIGLY